MFGVIGFPLHPATKAAVGLAKAQKRQCQSCCRCASCKIKAGSVIQATKNHTIFLFEFFFEIFSNLWTTFRSFRSFDNFSRNRTRRDDLFGPKIIEFRAILAIFRSFEDFYWFGQPIFFGTYISDPALHVLHLSLVFLGSRRRNQDPY